MEAILANALGAFNKYSGWIVWNLFLAFIPLVISFWLFLRPKFYEIKGSSLVSRRSFSEWRSPLWWLGFLVYFAFLPNAPYLLTDVIHLIEAIRAGYSIWITTLVFIPLHSIAIWLGWQAYVISLINQGYYLKRQGVSKFILGSELITHFLCAIGIYLGRFLRFNSWDLVTKPNVLFVSTIDELTDKRPLLVIAITFIVLTVAYWCTKQVTLGLLLRIRYSVLKMK